MFVVLCFACIILPKNKLFHGNTYHTVALLSTIIFTGIYFGIQFLKKESHGLAFSLYDVVFILFIALIFLSSVWARNPVYAYTVGFQWLIFYGVYKLFQHFSSIQKQLHFLVWSFTISFLISVSIIAILFIITADYSGGLTSIFNSDQFNLIRKKYFLHRNYISSFLVFGTGIPLYWIVKSTTKRQIILSASFLGYLSFVLMLSRSRGSLLAFFTILFLFYSSCFIKKTISRGKASISILFLLTSMFVAFILQADESGYVSLLNPLYGVQSADGDGRLQMWDISFKLISEQPWLGYGAGSWEFEYQKYGAGDLKNHSYGKSFYQHVHSYYIDTWFTLGISGLFCFTFLILIHPLFSSFKKLKQNEIRLVDCILFSGIFTFSIVALFYGTMYSNLIKQSCHTALLFAFIGVLNNKRNTTLKKINVIIPIIAMLIAGVIFVKANNNNKLFFSYQRALKTKNYATCEKSLNILEHRKLGFVNRKLSIKELRTKLYLKQKKYGLAEKSILTELEEHPYNFAIWKKMGDTQFKLKKYDQANYSYQQALLYNCDYIPASLGLLKTEKQLKNHHRIKAIKNDLLYINSFIKQFELNKPVWSKHLKLRKMHKAYKKYKKAIDKI